MNHKNLRKAIRKSLLENYFSDDAMKAAQHDMEASGEKFEPVGKSSLEKDLSIDDLMADLEAQEHEASAHELEKRHKDLSHLKRFGKGSLNEMQFIHTDPLVADMAKRMDKNKSYTNKEFIDLFTDKHAIQHSKVMDMIKSKLKDKGFKFEESIDEDSLEFRHMAGQREKSRKNVPLGKHAPHSDAAVEESIGVGLSVKKGMNIKPTHKK
jgi:hypothetical protein